MGEFSANPISLAAAFSQMDRGGVLISKPFQRLTRETVETVQAPDTVPPSISQSRFSRHRLELWFAASDLAVGAGSNHVMAKAAIGI